MDLLDIAARFLPDFDLLSEARLVARENTLGVERRKKPTAKKSAIEAKTLHTKNIISTFKAGGSVHLRSNRGGFGRSGGGGGGGGGGGSFGRPDAFRARPPNTSRPPSLHVDDFLVLELKGQQPTGPATTSRVSGPPRSCLRSGRRRRLPPGSSHRHNYGRPQGKIFFCRVFFFFKLYYVPVLDSFIICTLVA